MKEFIVAVILLSSLAGISQNKKTFNFSDTAFAIGQQKMIMVRYQTGMTTLDSTSRPMIDSLYRFLKDNPHIAIEIQNHSSSAENPNSSNLISMERAMSLVRALSDKGIVGARIKAIGWGNKKALVSEEQIRKAKTPEEKAALRSKNRRTEVKIISVSFTH